MGGAGEGAPTHGLRAAQQTTPAPHVSTSAGSRTTRAGQRVTGAGLSPTRAGKAVTTADGQVENQPQYVSHAAAQVTAT